MHLLRHHALVLRGPADACLRCEKTLSGQRLGLTGYRLKAGMTALLVPTNRNLSLFRHAVRRPWWIECHLYGDT